MEALASKYAALVGDALRTQSCPYVLQRIPKGFSKHIIDNGRHRQKATLRLSPIGKAWYVTIRVEAENMYFVEGWREFAQAHELSLGYLVVFLFEGAMVFTIKVFDQSCCLKEYPPIASMGANKKSDLKDPHLSKGSDEKKSDLKVRHLGNFSTIESFNPCVKRAPSTGSRAKRALICLPSHQPMPSQPWKGSMWPPRFSPKRPRRIEQTIRLSNLSGGCMELPRGFCTANNLLTDRELILRDPISGKSWRVNFRANCKYRLTPRSWAQFVADNNLKVGDQCIFELVPTEKNVIHVQIIKK